MHASSTTGEDEGTARRRAFGHRAPTTSRPAGPRAYKDFWGVVNRSLTRDKVFLD